MKHLNFLSKSSSQSCGHSSVTLAATVGSPSAHRRGAMLKLISVLVLIFTLGVGQMWGTDELVHTLNYYKTGSGTQSSYTGVTDFTSDDGITWNVPGNQTTNPPRIGANSSTALSNTQRCLYSKTAISDNITKVVIEHGSTSNITVNSFTFAVFSSASDAQNNTNAISSLSRAFKANDTIIFNRPANTSWEGRFYRITYTLTGAEKQTNYLQFKNAKFYKEAAVARTVTLMDDASHPLQEQTAGAGVTLPSRESCDGYTFAGWTASWEEEQDEWTTTAPTIIPAGTYHPSADISLYPVYTKSEGGSGFTLSLTYSNTEYYIAPRSGSNSYFGVTTNSANAETFYTDNDALYIYESSTKTYVSESDNNTSLEFDTSDPTGWTITNSSNIWTFQSKGTGTRHLAWNYNNGSPRFAAYTGSNTYLYQYTKHSASTISYISVPNCCTPLGQINGSVLVTHFLSHFYLFSFVNFILTMSKVISFIFQYRTIGTIVCYFKFFSLLVGAFNIEKD